MDEKNWHNVKEIFLAALEKDASDRTGFLDEICADDSDLRQEIESLLASHEEIEDFIEKPAFEVGEVFTTGANQTEKHFGNYKIIHEIGAGGMGAVFLAERSDGEFEQKVAIKIIRQAIAESELISRFKRERQILATLNHPNIAKLLDGGVSDDGLPFLAMEYIEGEAITKFAERENLKLEERLKLFLKVCSAVAYAHRNLTVHRDIKPSNILVTKEGEPKLLDFGLAKLIDENLSNDTEQTQTAFRALTPAYASPEQLKNEPITTSSDIYSLGIVLYELLTGERPFQFEGKSLEEIIKTVTTFEPPPPSANPQSAIRNPKLKGDLDNIALMALRKEPERRYKSVEAFAEDIERHLKGLPVAARPNTFRYRTEKFIQRNRVGVFAASLVLIAVLAGLITTGWQSRVAAHERDQAQQAQAKAEQINSFLQSILSAASPEEKGKDAKVIEVLNDAVQNIDTKFGNQTELKAQALLTIGQTYYQLGLMDEAEKTLRQSLKLNSELYGEENKATSSCMIYLGSTVLDQAKFDESEQLLTKAIETERKLSSAGNKELALALAVLGELYVRKAAFEKAKPLLEESVAMSDKLLGENNADSAYTLISLGRAQMFSGDLVGAEATYRQSVAIYRQLSSRYEVRLAVALLNLGLLLVTKKDYDNGIGIMREADIIFFQKQGESFSSFESHVYLCIAYFSKADYSQAIVEGNKAIAIGRKLKLENASDFIATLDNVGLALTRTGKAKEGEPFLREALKIRIDSLPKENFGIALANSELGECLTAQKRYAEAEPLLTESYESLKTSQGTENPRTVLAKSRLATLYEKTNRAELAAQYR